MTKRMTRQHAMRAAALLAGVALSAALHGGGVSNPISICGQTDQAAFYRLTEDSLSLDWDWSWDWMPRNATGGTIRVQGAISGLDRTYALAATDTPHLTVENLLADDVAQRTDILTVTLTVGNAAGKSASKSFTRDVVPGAFGAAHIRRSATESLAWRGYTLPLVVPMDNAWFNLSASTMAATLLATNGTT